MASDTKPTVLLVHGAWHRPASMQPFRDVLKARGYDSICPALPTMGDKKETEFRKKTVYDDAKVVRDEVAKLVDDGKEVLAVAHSYGGQVMSEAVRHEYSREIRSADGKKGGVLGLAFICAFFVPEGKVGQLAAAKRFPPPPYLVPNPFKGYLSTRRGADFFYNEMPAAEAKKWEKQLVCCSLFGQGKPATYAAHRYYKTLYVHALRDKAIAPQLQKQMVRLSRDAGIAVEREVELESDHSPYLSQPERLADELESFLAMCHGS